MNEIQKTTASPFDAIKQIRPDGSEFWSARDLAPLMGYETRDAWKNFEHSLERARASAGNQGNQVGHHFAGSSKVIEGGRWGNLTVSDYELTRFAAYLVAMNGDPNKPEVAAAQAYFAIQTHAAETRPALSGKELMAAALLEAQETMQELETTNQAQAAQLEADAPKVEHFERFLSEDSDVLTIEDWGAQFGLTKPQAFNLLRDKKIIRHKPVTREFSKRKDMQVDRLEHRAYAPYRYLFDLRQQEKAPRYNNGQLRQTLYVYVTKSLELASIAGVETLPMEGIPNHV